MLMRTLVIASLAALMAGCVPAMRPLPPQRFQSGAVAHGRHKRCTWKLVLNDRRVRRGGLLNGIRALSSNNAWAVGAHGAGLSLIEHWNGSKWKLSPSVDPSSTLNVLFKVSGSSSSDVWAVGEYSNSKGTIQPLIEHWNGTRWSLSKSPLVGNNGGYFSDVVALAKNDAWAVGVINAPSTTGVRQMLTEHWNGKTWSLVRTPMVTSNESFLTTVVARASNDVWAGGGYNNGTTGSSLGFTIHWDGKKWSVVKLDPLKSPYYPVEGLTAVPGGGALFALGSYDDNKRKRYSEFAEQLGKSSWSQLNPLGPNDYYYFGDTTFITGAAATSNFGVYGVGYYTRGGLVSTFAMVWDGSRWAVTLTPNVAGYDSFLNAASAIPGTKNVWAAGGFSLGSTAGPLIEHGECM